MKEYKKVILLSTVTAFVLSGCSVKPEAIKPEVVKADVTKTMQMLEKVVQPVTKPISLDEAIQRAIDHNLNRRLDILTSALAEQKIDIVAYEALPSLTTKAGYTARDSYNASYSSDGYDPVSDTNGNLITSAPTSSDPKKENTASIGFSWNILDFGVSYVRATQQANRFLIAKEKERKSIHNIKQEVRNAYYKAVSADELLKRLAPISEEAKKAFADSVKIKDLKIDSPIKSLTYQRELLEVIRSLNTLEENLMKSKTELSQLMGLKPGTSFELSERIKERYELPEVALPIEDLERLALENRPELQETRYQIKISQDEVRTSMLKMLPGINFDAGFNYSNSDYLVNNNWINYGGSITWNLMNLFNGPLNKKLAETQVELAKQQSLALSMAVVSQVHLSLIDLAQAKKEYQLSEVYYGIAKEIYDIIKNENTLDVNGKLSLIKEKLNFLISNLRLSSSYAKVQNAYGKVISSVGDEKVFTPKVEVVKEIVEEKKPELVVVEEVKKEEPKVETPAPAPVVVKEEPKVETPAPAPVVVKEEPKVETPAPAPVVVKEEPKVETPAPAPVVVKEEPKVVEVKPVPVVVETPAPTSVVETTAPTLKVEPAVYDNTKPAIEIINVAKLVDKAGGNYNTIKIFGVGEKLNYTQKIVQKNNTWYQIADGGYVHSSKVKEIVEVKPAPMVVETPTPAPVIEPKVEEPKIVEVKPELAEIKVEEVKPEPVVVKEVPKVVEVKPAPVVVETPAPAPVIEQKVEEPKVAVETKPAAVVETTTYNDAKPTIEIKSDAKLVKFNPTGYDVIKTIKAGTKINFIKKIYTGNSNFWYEVDGGYIHTTKAKEIN